MKILLLPCYIRLPFVYASPMRFFLTMLFIILPLAAQDAAPPQRKVEAEALPRISKFSPPKSFAPA